MAIGTTTTLGLALDTAGIYRKIPGGVVDNVYVFSDGVDTWEMVDKMGEYVVRLGGVLSGGGDMTSRLQTILDNGNVLALVFDLNAITVNGTLNCYSKKIIFKNRAKIIGTGTINGAIISADIRSDIFAQTINLTNCQADGNYVSVKWFGAVGSGAVNDQPACQKAVDVVIANDKMPRTVKFIGGEEYRFDSPLMMYKWDGSNYNFFHCNLNGEPGAWFGTGTGHAKITFTGNQTFAIGLQLARSSEIVGLIIKGQFSFSWNVYNAADYRYLENNFDTFAAATGCRDTFNSPYSGIVFEPFINAAIIPSDGGYPGMTSWYRGTGDRTGSGSSGVRIKDCEISGFVIDIMVSPNGVTQNAEDIHIESCRLEVAKAAYASGSDQNKNNTIQRCATWDRVHTLVTTGNYGWGSGLPPNIDGWNIASGTIMRIWYWATNPPRFPAVFKNIFAELLYSIGYGSGGAGFTVEDCEFGMNTFGPYYLPKWHIFGDDIIFKNCVIRYYDNNYNTPLVMRTNATFESCLLNMFPMWDVSGTRENPRLPVFINCRTGNGFVWGQSNISRTPGNNNNTFIAWGSFSVAKYTFQAPNMGVNIVQHFMNPTYHFKCNAASFQFIIGPHNYTVDDATRKMTVTGLTGSNKEYMIAVGDHVLIGDSSFFYAGVVESIDRPNGSFVVKHVPVYVEGGPGYNSLTIVGQQHILAGQWIGDLTAGSNVITNVDFDEFFYDPYVGQRVYNICNGPDVPVITAVDKTAKTITLSMNAQYTKAKHYNPVLPYHLGSFESECAVMTYEPPRLLGGNIDAGMMMPRGMKLKNWHRQYQINPANEHEWTVAVPGWISATQAGKFNQLLLDTAQTHFYGSDPAANFTAQVSPNKIVSVLMIKSNQAEASIDIGLTANGNELADNVALVANTWKLVSIPPTYFENVGTIYFSGITTGTTFQVRLY